MAGIDIPLNVAIFMAFKPLIKIYLSASLGFISVKVGILTPEGTSVISQMILNFFLPCLVFSNIVGNIQIADIRYLGILMVTVTMYISLGAVWALVIRLTTPVPKAWMGGMVMATMLNNSGDLPIAYVTTLGNSEYFPSNSTSLGTAYCVLFSIGFNLILFNFGVGKILKWDADVRIPNKFEPTVPPLSFQKAWLLLKGKKGAQNQEQQESLPPVFAPQSTTQSHEAPVTMFSDRPRRSSIASFSTSSILIPDARTIDDIQATSDVITMRRIRSRSICEDKTYEAKFDIENAKREEEYREVAMWKRCLVPMKKGWLKMKSKNKFLEFMCNFLENLTRIQAMSVAVSLLVAFVPWIRRLFVDDPNQHVSGIPNAPDGLPPLDFIMDFVSFMGECQVQLGLFMLGGTIARLKVQTLPPGFWKTLVSLVLFKLVLLPIFAVFWTSQVKRMGWFSSDMPMFPIIMTVTSGTPGATTQIYLTLLYTLDPADAAEQLNCFGASLIANYITLPVTMTILMTYTIKNLL